ncbi:hypothetical protein [Agrococcus sp. DT81.2]|uniref:hypothetical protein n=1 Tax=Agrococcus sp. DT81.2 TaxID=3393414 RepID=UPI003CE5924B
MTGFHAQRSREPFDRPQRLGAMDWAAEVERLRRSAAARWIAEHRVTWTVDELLQRAAAVGQEQAAGEAIEARNAAGSRVAAGARLWPAVSLSQQVEGAAARPD